MIVCFSGTGNSRFVARELARELGERVYMLEHKGLLEFGREATTDARVIWVFPTYSWGIPPVVVAAIKRSHCSGNTTHHMVTTCGDDVGRIADQWRHLMADKGYAPGNAYSVTMPNTYTLMAGFDVDPAPVVEAKLKAAPVRVADIARRIAAGTPGDDLATGRWTWVKSRVIYPWFIRHAMSPRPFMTRHDVCTQCGLCIRQCPCDNISRGKDGYPTWGEHCALCLRCYHGCPHHAIEYGNKTRGKGQYILR